MKSIAFATALSASAVTFAPPQVQASAPSFAQWRNHVSPRVVRHAAAADDHLWVAAAHGGVVAWNVSTGATTQFTRVGDCLPGNDGLDIAVSPTNGDVWFATFDGLGLLPNGGTGGEGWIVLDETNSPLTSGAVSAVCAPGNGVVWIGTYDEGAWKLEDGVWTNFNPGNSGLSDVFVTSIAVDLRGDVWFGAWGDGVDRYDGETWINYPPTGANGITAPAAGGGDPCGILATPPQFLGLISAFVRIHGVNPVTGDIWFRNDDDGFCGLNAMTRFDGTSFSTYTVQNSGILTNNVIDTGFDGEGNTWFVSGTAAQSFDGTSFTTHPDVHASTVDRVGDELWFGTAQSVVRYDGRSFTELEPAQGLAGHPVRAIGHDPASGDAWIGSPGGLQRLSGDAWETFDADNSPLLHTNVHAIEPASDGSLWVGLHGSIARRQGSSWTIYEPAETGLFRASTITEAADGAIWAASDLGGLARFDGGAWGPVAHGLSSTTIRDITRAPNGDLWFASSGVTRFNGTSWRPFTVADGLPSNVVWDLAIGADGVVWAATNDGLARIDGTTVTAFHVGNGQMRSVDVGADGVVWVGTWDGGVAQRDPTTGAWAWSFHADGLVSERSYALAIAPDGAAWFGTDLGISVRRPGPACPGDVDASGGVGFADLSLLLERWGPCPPAPVVCTGDVDASGAVGFSDLNLLLSAWGDCP